MSHKVLVIKQMKVNIIKNWLTLVMLLKEGHIMDHVPTHFSESLFLHSMKKRNQFTIILIYSISFSHHLYK